MELENWYLNRMRISIFPIVCNRFLALILNIRILRWISYQNWIHCKYPLKLFGKMQKIAFSQKSFSMWSIILEEIYFKDKATKTEFDPVRVQVSATTFVSSN